MMLPAERGQWMARSFVLCADSGKVHGGDLARRGHGYEQRSVLVGERRGERMSEGVGAQR